MVCSVLKNHDYRHEKNLLENRAKRKQRMFLPKELVPEEIMMHYDLHPKIHNAKVLMCISKGMYGPKEIGPLKTNNFNITWLRMAVLALNTLQAYGITTTQRQHAS